MQSRTDLDLGTEFVIKWGLYEDFADRMKGISVNTRDLQLC